MYLCIVQVTLSIREDGLMNLSLLGALPHEESNIVFLPTHHIVDASSFGFTVCVLLMGKSPYSSERLLQVAKDHFYETESCLLHSMRTFGDDLYCFWYYLQ